MVEMAAKAETGAGSEKVAVAKVGVVTVAGVRAETMTVAVAKVGVVTVAGSEAGATAGAVAGATPPPP